MAQKRSAMADEMTGREKKKLKVSAARTIAVQSTPGAGSSSVTSVNKSQTDSK